MIIRKLPRPTKYCNRCESLWQPHKDNPKFCGVCGSPYWNKPRTRAPTVMKIPDEMRQKLKMELIKEPQKVI